MKSLIITSLFLATASVAQAGACVAYDSLHQPLCSQQFLKESCMAHVNVCTWLEMDASVNSTKEEATAEFKLN